MSYKHSASRFAFVTGTLQLGGSTTFLCNLGGELIRRGISCYIFSDGSAHPLGKDFESRQIPVSVQDSRRAIFEDRLKSVLQQLRKYEPTAVVATLAPFAYETLRYVPLGVTRVAMVQSDDPLVYQTVEKYRDYIDIIVGVSATIVRRLSKMERFEGVSKRYLPYGVPIPSRGAELARASDVLRILYLGRIINEQKRVYIFPQIASALEKAAISFSWTIAGDGPDLLSLKNNMKSLQLNSRVEFSGTLPYEEVGRVLDSHDVLVLTSDYEGLPLSLLEAMAHGLVPVVTDLESGIREVVDDSNGILVKANDLKGYAKAIAHLSGHREELIAKSHAAQERVRTEFSVAAMTDRWLSVVSPVEGRSFWPNQFHMKGPLTDIRQWRYLPVVRQLRRGLKRLRRA